MGDFVMPSLGADMDAGTLLEWRVKVGDHVKRGDIVAEVDTDKAAIEIEVFEEGDVEEILVQQGEKVPVGAVLARISGGAAAPAPVAAAPEPVAASPEPPVVPVPAPEASSIAAPAMVAAAPAVAPAPLHEITRTRHVASPLARKTAAALGVDLAAVTGTGPGGAITREDVARAARVEQRPSLIQETPVIAAGPALGAHIEPVVPSPEETAAARRATMRQRIGMQMARSKREIPHYYLAATVDMTAANAWLAEWNATHGVNDRLLPAVLFIKAVALAIHEVPEMNGFYEGDAFKQSAAVHPGVAVSIKDTGLIAPAIHDADSKTLPELMGALRDLVARARKGGLRASEMADPTITVTNLGDLGVEEVFGVIQPPQVALVGFGKVMDRPWAENGMLGVRPIVRLTLSADHRVSDGHRGGLFLAAIDRLLQKPEEL